MAQKIRRKPKTYPFKVWMIVNVFGRTGIPIFPTAASTRADAWAKFENGNRDRSHAGHRAERFRAESC